MAAVPATAIPATCRGFISRELTREQQDLIGRQHIVGRDKLGRMRHSGPGPEPDTHRFDPTENVCGLATEETTDAFMYMAAMHFENAFRCPPAKTAVHAYIDMILKLASAPAESFRLETDADAHTWDIRMDTLTPYSQSTPPFPGEDGQTVTDLVMPLLDQESDDFLKKQIRKRTEEGIVKYGVALQTNNKRSQFYDFREEMLDLAHYITAIRIYEIEIAPTTDTVATLDWIQRVFDRAMKLFFV